MKGIFNFFRRKKVSIGQSDKTLQMVVHWLETHGIEKSVAAQVHGFLSAHNLKLPPIALCQYGLPYSFSEFLEWFEAPVEDCTPKVNDLCIFWNGKDHHNAIIGVLTDCDLDDVPLFSANKDMLFDNCIKFTNMSAYRTVLNTPNDVEEIGLPEYAYMVKVKQDIADGIVNGDTLCKDEDTEITHEVTDEDKIGESDL